MTEAYRLQLLDNGRFVSFFSSFCSSSLIVEYRAPSKNACFGRGWTAFPRLEGVSSNLANFSMALPEILNLLIYRTAVSSNPEGLFTGCPRLLVLVFHRQNIYADTSFVLEQIPTLSRTLERRLCPSLGSKAASRCVRGETSREIVRFTENPDVTMSAEGFFLY